MTSQADFDTNDFLVRIGGKEYRDVDPIFDDETVEKIRQGYICIECFQHFESAFPETCPFPLCDARPRADQSLSFLRKFKGQDPYIFVPSEPEPVSDRLRRNGIFVPGGSDD